MNRAACGRRWQGTAMVETLLAAPLVMLLGLGALQWALLMHARTAVEYGLLEATRAGSVAQARPAAIEAGLARGLMPYWFGVDVARPWAAAVGASNAQLRQGLAAGWIVLRQHSPTQESFADWGEPARDAMGAAVSGVIEIPNDSLQWSALRQPASGAAGMRGSEPIGTASQQTLNDANLLKLELRYGVPMTVPLVGRLAVWLMRIVDGCAPTTRRVLGAFELGTPSVSPTPRAWACAMYLAPDAAGMAIPRWPVRVSATIRMQSAARRSALTQARTQSALHGASPGLGQVGPWGSATAPDPSQVTSSGSPLVPPEAGPALVQAGDPVSSSPIVLASAADDGSLARGTEGWLHIGADRAFTVPGACP